MTQTLKLNEKAGADKPAPAKETPAIDLKRVLARGKGPSVLEGTLNPPKWRSFKGKKFAGESMAEYFSDKTLKNADFTGCDLSGADFSDFDLQGSRFINCKLDGTLFLRADLRWADFTGSEWKNAVLWNLDDDEVPVDVANIHEVTGITR